MHKYISLKNRFPLAQTLGQLGTMAQKQCVHIASPKGHRRQCRMPLVSRPCRCALREAVYSSCQTYCARWAISPSNCGSLSKTITKSDSAPSLQFTGCSPIIFLTLLKSCSMMLSLADMLTYSANTTSRFDDGCRFLAAEADEALKAHAQASTLVQPVHP